MAQYRCPECKKSGGFVVYGWGSCDVSIFMDNEGEVEDVEAGDISDSYDWENHSTARCQDCGYEDEWNCFDVENQDECEEEGGGLPTESGKSDVDDMLSYIDRRLGES